MKETAFPEPRPQDRAATPENRSRRSGLTAVSPPAPRSESRGRSYLLALTLRIAGCVMLAAFGAMLLPERVMAVVHEGLGIGPFPASPLVSYLTRSISALYGIHGCLYLLVAGDLTRYRPLIALLAILNVVFGSVVIVIDLHAGMPWFWTLAEGPSIVIVGLLWVALLRGVPRQA